MRLFFMAGLLIAMRAWAAGPSFDVASIKPSAPDSRQALNIQPGGRFVANGVSLQLLIGLAWHLQQRYEMAGGDGWVTPPAPAGAFRAGPGAIIGTNASMTQFITILSRYMDRPVIDKTGVTGLFNATLQFDPASAPKQLSGSVGDAAPGSDPSIFAALQERLGLKLEAAQEAVEVLVIDHAERPSGN